MFPSEEFRFCPRCGTPRRDIKRHEALRCGQCGFLYYFNPAIATAAFVCDGAGRVLFIRRAKDPARGRLSIPGGFVDIDETAEDAVRREVQEEVRLTVGPLEFLCTVPNTYEYQHVTYPLLDLFFITTASEPGMAMAADEVESVSWLEAGAVSPEGIAFPSVREALRRFVARGGH